jgi:dihydrolipoamide dehydrogenase
MNRRVEVAVIGAGHAGLNAIAEVRRTTPHAVLIAGGGPGSTWARTGRGPTEVAQRLAAHCARRPSFGHRGGVVPKSTRINGGNSDGATGGLRADPAVPTPIARWNDDPDDDWDDGLMTDTRAIDSLISELRRSGALIEDYARFIGPTVLRAGGETIEAGAVVIAAGARSRIPAQWWERLGERILTLDSLFALQQLPASVAVLGLGPIGLELGQALRRLGVRVIGVMSSGSIADLPDPVINQAALDALGREFPLWIGADGVLEAQGDPDGGQVLVSAGPNRAVVDRVLVADGRHPNLEGLNLVQTGCTLDRRGVPVHHPATLRIGRLPIYIAGMAGGGDVTLYGAAEQGRVAGYNACHRTPIELVTHTPRNVVWCEPNIAWVGPGWPLLDHAHLVVGQVRFGPLGPDRIGGLSGGLMTDPTGGPAEEQGSGLLRVYADRRDGRILGGAMLGPGSEQLSHLLAWGVQQGLVVQELLAIPGGQVPIAQALRDALHELARRIRPVPSNPSVLRRLVNWRGGRAVASG